MRHSQRALALAFLAFTGFASSPAFANVLTVAPSGANYTQIQAAVTASSSGDVILISPGSYGAVTIDGKSLTLCSKGGGIVSIVGTTTVKNLTASQRVILSGLKGLGPATQVSGWSELGAGLAVTNNAGHVRVEYCSFEGAIGFGDGTTGSGIGGSCCSMAGGRDGAFVSNNTQGVAFIACELKGGRGANSLVSIWCDCGNGGWGADGLKVLSTLVSLYDCTCIGGQGGKSGTAGYGGHGCVTSPWTSNPTGAFASGTTFQGGNGGDSWEFYPAFPGGNGGSGLWVAGMTSVHLLDNTYIGGPGGFSVASPGGAPGPPTNPGQPGAPVAGAGSIFYEPESKLVMTTDRVARAGSIVDVRIQGVPNQNMFLIVSRAPTFQILPSWRGTLLSLQGKGSVVVPVGRIPASGVLQTRYLVPPLPAGVSSSTVFMQAVRSDMAAGPKLAAGTAITLLH